MLSVFHTDRFLRKQHNIQLAMLPCGGKRLGIPVGCVPGSTGCHLQSWEQCPPNSCPAAPSFFQGSVSTSEVTRQERNPGEWAQALVTPKATIKCGVPGILQCLCDQTAPWPSCRDTAVPVMGTEISMPTLWHRSVAKASTSPCQWAGCHMNRWRAAQPCQGSGWLHPRSCSTRVSSNTPASCWCQYAWLKILDWG